jgi:hypothetical protein
MARARPLLNAAAMRERKPEDAREQGVAGNDEGERDPRRERAMQKRRQERRAERSGGAPKGEVVEAGADEMSAVSVDETEVQAVRDRQIDRYTQADHMGMLALHRAESIWRRREAAPALAKGFGKTAEKSLAGWFRGKLEDAFKGVLKMAEIGIDTATKSVGFVREGVEGGAEAERAAAQVDAIDALVNSTTHNFKAATAQAIAQVRGAAPAELFRLDLDRGPIITSADLDLLVVRLEAELFEAEREHMTVNETVDRFQHDRKDLGAEIEASKKAHTE